jgi:hypothetical protein
MGVGSSSAPYMIGQDAARNASQNRAASDLHKRLLAGEETVPCPHCQWVNTSAIRAYRKTRQRGWTTLAFFIAVIGLITNIITLGMSRDVLGRDTSLADPLHYLIAACWILPAALCFLAQFLLRQRFDPNQTHAGKRRLPAGTPPALLPLGKNAAGESQFEIVPYDLSQIDHSSTWATFRAGQFSLLPLCCRCLGQPSDTPLRFPFVVQAQPMPVPMCDRCRKTVRAFWWLANFSAVLAAIALSFLLSRLPTRVDDVGRSILWFLASFFTSIVAVCLVDHFIRPYRSSAVDASRAIFRIRFRNPAYTALLIRKIGEADGYFKKDSPPA